MNRADRAPLLLIVASALLILAVVAYVINDAQDNSQWKEAALHGQRALHVQAQQSIDEMKSLEEERAQSSRDRAELHEQYEVMLESLNRIEMLLEGRVPTEPARCR